MTNKGFSFILIINGNPLLRNLELTDELKKNDLQYQSIIKGAIRGVFEILKFKANVIIIHEVFKLDKNETGFFVDVARE
jgi:hypothetical protein